MVDKYKNRIPIKLMWMNIIEYELSINVCNWLNINWIWLKMIYSIRIQSIFNLHLIHVHVHIFNPFQSVSITD